MNRFAYSLLLYLALPFVPLKLWWRGLKQPAYRQHWGERFGFYAIKITQPVIWLHCVSVGETRAAEPLINALQLQYPNHQILLTHGTPTGRDTSEAVYGNKVQRVYLPYDLPFAVNNFLAHFQPKIGLIMETELWFNLIAACKQKQCPLLLLNARLSEKSFNGYLKVEELAREGLQNLSAIAAQSADDANRLQILGAQNISVAGNLKFDVKPPADAANKGLQLRKLLGNKPIFLAASTREGEEYLILEAVKDLDILTIIVPRHPQRFDEVAAIFQKHNMQFQRKSQLNSTALQPNIHAVLGDTMSELFSYYAACDFTFIGGSLLPFGGQNLIEAATMAKPILVGPHTFNFAEASKHALTAGAALQVENAASLKEKIIELSINKQLREQMAKAALDFSAASTGATARLMQLIAQFLH